MDFGFSDSVSRILFYIALVGWAITFLGMLHAPVFRALRCGFETVRS
jgi:hypothetical protein